MHDASSAAVTIYEKNSGSIDMDQKETIKIQGRSSGMWFTRKKDTDTSSVKNMPQDPPRGSESTISKPRPTPSRSSTLWFTNKPAVEEPSEEPDPQVNKPTRSSTVTRRRPSRSATVSGFWPGKTSNNESAKDDIDIPNKPKHQKSRSETAVVPTKKRKQTSLERQDQGGEGK